MARRLIDSDPTTGITTYLHTEADGTFHIETEQDTTQTFEINKTLREDSRYEKNEQNHESLGRHVATIPDGILIEIKDKYGLDWNDKNHKQQFLKVVQRDYPQCLTVPKLFVGN